MKTKHNFVNLVSSITLLSLRSFRTKHNQSFLRRRAWALLSSIVSILVFVATDTSFAGSTTWGASPRTSDWFTATNWTPATVPNSPAAPATCASSNRTRPFIAFNAEVNGIAFNPGASAFTIMNLPGTSPTLTISGAGVTNNSEIVQNFDFEQAGAQIVFLN